jgi:hypothetical protein
METMENKKHEWFRLKKSGAKAVLIYFIILIVISLTSLLFISVEEINPLRRLSIFSFSIIAAIITSILGSSIFYSRKLYKACINLDMVEPMSESDKVRQLGIIMYYSVRPLYSAALSVITCIALRSSTEFITKDGGINGNFPLSNDIIIFCWLLFR